MRMSWIVYVWLTCGRQLLSSLHDYPKVLSKAETVGRFRKEKNPIKIYFLGYVSIEDAGRDFSCQG